MSDTPMLPKSVRLGTGDIQSPADLVNSYERVLLPRYRGRGAIQLYRGEGEAWFESVVDMYRARFDESAQSSM